MLYIEKSGAIKGYKLEVIDQDSINSFKKQYFEEVSVIDLEPLSKTDVYKTICNGDMFCEFEPNINDDLNKQIRANYQKGEYDTFPNILFSKKKELKSYLLTSKNNYKNVLKLPRSLSILHFLLNSDYKLVMNFEEELREFNNCFGLNRVFKIDKTAVDSMIEHNMFDKTTSSDLNRALAENGKIYKKLLSLGYKQY